MKILNTEYPTWVYDDYLVDPSIMDGNVPHKPQDPYGSGKRDLIIVSFEK